MSYTQGLILLGVPEEERAQFIAELDLESMSARELQKAVQERNRAAAERDQALQERAELQQVLTDQEGQITKMSGEQANLLSKVKELTQAKANKVAFLYESLDRTFRELLWELKEFAKQEPESYKVYKNKLVDFLTKSLKANM